MNKKRMIALLLVIVGSVFLIGGVYASINRISNTAICEACGMEITKADASTFRVVSNDGAEHWACCPICGEVVGLHYGDAELYAQCYVTGDPITIHVSDGEFSTVSVSLPNQADDVTIVLGGSCMTNKIVSSIENGELVCQSYAWASEASLKTVPASFMAAKNKLTQMTVSYRPVAIPQINYILIGIGLVLLLAAPLTMKYGPSEPTP